jgi:hypothetical protein
MPNHNEAIAAASRNLKVRSNVRAGGVELNHNEAQIRPIINSRSLRLRTNVRSGGITLSLPRM